MRWLKVYAKRNKKKKIIMKHQGRFYMEEKNRLFFSLKTENKSTVTTILPTQGLT